MGHQSHGNEVEESISKQKLEDTFVTSEKLKEPRGENEEAEERKYELEVENKCGDLKAALKESSRQINESNENLIITGGDASVSECINNTETTASEQTGIPNVIDKAAKGMKDMNGEIEDERTADPSLGNEVEERISKQKLENAVVSVKYDSEVTASLNELYISERLEEPSGEKEMELQNQCRGFNEKLEGSPKDLNGHLNGELEVESQQDSELNSNLLTLDLSLPSPKETQLIKVNVAVSAKGRKYRETISNLQAESESLKLENSVLATELEVSKDKECSLDKIVEGLKEGASTLNSRLAAQNELQWEHEKVVLVFKSLHEKIAQTDNLLVLLTNENTSLQKQVKASKKEFLDHWDTFNEEKSKELEEIKNQNRKIEEGKVKLESLERQEKQSRDKFEEAQEVSKKKDQEIKFVEKRSRGVRSLYNGDVRDLTNGCAVMKAHFEDAKGKFDEKMDYLEDKLQAVETKLSELLQRFQTVKTLKEQK